MMADNGLTRVQLEQLDFITPILPDEEVRRMSTMQLENYKDLLNARDAAEADFVRQNKQNDAYKQQANEPAPEPEPKPEQPVKAVEAPETPVTTEPEAAAPVEPDIPETTVDPAQVEYWRQKAEESEKRRREAQAALSPAQQKAATMRKKLDAKDEVFESVKNELAELKALVAKLATQPTQQVPAAPDPLAGLEETDPDLASRLRALKEELRSELKQTAPAPEVDEIRQHLDAIKQQAAEREFAAFKAEHDAAVCRLQPDLPVLLSTPEGAKDLADWLAKQPPVVQAIMQNPYAHTPYDMSFVIDQYKRSKRSPSAAKKPSLGDLAAKASLSPVTPLLETNNDPALLSDEQVRNIDRLIEAEAKKGKEGNPEALLERYAYTMSQKMKLASSGR